MSCDVRRKFLYSYWLGASFQWTLDSSVPIMFRIFRFPQKIRQPEYSFMSFYSIVTKDTECYWKAFRKASTFIYTESKEYFLRRIAFFCDSEAWTPRRSEASSMLLWKDSLFIEGELEEARTDKVVDMHACLCRSQPSSFTSIILHVYYSWELLFATLMINNMRREAHVYMCSLFFCDGM